MRIALDATPLVEPAGGLARYVTELTLALALQQPGDEIHLLSDQTELHLDQRLLGVGNIRLDPPARWGRSKWWSIGLPFELRRRGIEIFHGANFEVPYLKLVPSVMTVHDLSPWKAAPLRPPGCERVRSRTPRLIRLARRVITPTEAVRLEVLEQFHLSPEAVAAISHAPSDALRPPEAEEGAAVRRRLGLPDRYLLAIGAGNERKNIPVLVEAWQACRQHSPALGLVVLGVGAAKFQTAGLCAVEAASDAETAASLSGAAAFVYPSLYEGFGLPVVEAMRAGVPVLTSTDPALVEVADGAALHFDPSSAQELTIALLKVLSDPAEAARLATAGRRRVENLTWSATAQKTRSVYAEAIRGK